MSKQLIQKVVEKLKELEHLKAIILYGSYARGEETKRSDIDLLIVLNVTNPKQYLKKVINLIGDVDKEGRISPRLTNLKDYDLSFIQNVLREGKVLFGAVVVDNKKLMLKPYILVNYKLSDLDNVKRVRISRRVYGYISKKNINGKVKKYEYKGLKDEEDIFVYSPSTVLIPEKKKGFIDFLKREGVSFKEKNIWL